MKNTGRHTHRFKQNPLEKQFATAWEEVNANYNVLDYLLAERGQEPDTSDRDRLVAATVIQWLGSPVGQVFLIQVAPAEG